VSLIVAGIWSVGQLILGITWLTGWNALPGNPFDPQIDIGGAATSVLTGLGADGSAVALTVLASSGLVLVLLMASLPAPRSGGRSWWRMVVTALAAVQGLVLALLLPDYRLIATIGYTPVVAVQQVLGLGGRVTLAELYNQTTIAMILMTLTGLAFVAAAVVFNRRMGRACAQCGRTDHPARWTSSAAAARWGKWVTVVAIVIPVGYATTRWAWALGIPLGVSEALLVQIGSYVWMGAALGTLAIGGAVLTAGLVRPWGEVFPRWIPGLRGRRVPIWMAVIPALLVSVIVTSAGLMFQRLGLTGTFAANFPGNAGDIAAWLPELFWPLWGAALAAAAIAYWLRRRGVCSDCGRDT
jgi:hypothetical protein